MHTDSYVAALGAVTGNQAIEMVQAGLKAIYGSGWQVAADNNTAGDVYPDQSLYPCDSAPALVKRINRALMRADQIESAEGKGTSTYWFAPIVADAEAGFGGSLNAYELMKAMIEAGAAGGGALGRHFFPSTFTRPRRQRGKPRPNPPPQEQKPAMPPP